VKEHIIATVIAYDEAESRVEIAGFVIGFKYRDK